jgi:phage regulator Rha-like protein
MSPFQALVEINDGEPLASTEIIAEGMGVQHKAVIQLLRRYSEQIQRFGSLTFQTRVKRKDRRGGEATEFAMLNERQAMLLISLMRNTEAVVAFKVSLITEFARMRDAIQQIHHNTQQRMYAALAREEESKLRASFGSHLMLVRKSEIPHLRSEIERLEAEIQPSLQFH